MGSNEQEGGAHARAGAFSAQRRPARDKPGRRQSCGGFSNAQLIGGIALLAIITLLLQIQSGDLNPLALFQRPAKAAAGATKDKSAARPEKAPPLIAPQAKPLSRAAQTYVELRKAERAEAEWAAGKTSKAFAHMDESAAAALLVQLDDTLAAGILARLSKYDLARILAAAPPERAAAWVKQLLAAPALPEVPGPFREEAKRAGLFNDTQELLRQWQEEQLGAAGQSPAAPAASPEPAPAPGAPESAPPAGATTPAPADGTPSSPAGIKPPASSNAKPSNGQRAGSQSPQRRARQGRRLPRTNLI